MLHLVDQKCSKNRFQYHMIIQKMMIYVDNSSAA